MNLKSLRVFGSRKRVGAVLALLSLLVMGALGSCLMGVGLAVLFLAAGFLTLPDRKWLVAVLRFVWLAGFILLSCCYPSWMAEYHFFRISANRIFLNIVCACVVYGFFLLLFGRIRPAAAAAAGALLLLSVANTFVYQFRGSELQWADFMSIRTAMNVAAGYSFHLPLGVAGCVLLWVWTQFAGGLLPKESAHPLIARTCGTAAVLVCAFLFSWKGTGTLPEFWKKDGTLFNGYLLNFSLGLRDSMIEKPQDYPDLIARLEEQYPEQAASLPEELPNIVVIMDESLADMRILGDLKTNQPVTPFLDSLSDNTVRGYALSSVFGGSTASSEFEFLTGCSMAFLPKGSIAYQQYLHQTVYSLPWLLQSYGYETFATHPYFETGWNRQTAYELLGFEQATFLGAYPEEDLVREYISDREMFQYVLDQLEQQGDAPLFLFGITMQNHGSYGDANYQNTISLQGESFFFAEQYLSLIHETDEALEQLLSQLENYPRKTIVLIFGDHFPALEDGFFRSLHGSFDTLSDQMLQYQVPFYLWANYDIPEQTVGLTSLNYLAVHLLETAGLPLSPYYQFLSDVQEAIPAINANGFYSPDGQVLTKDQANDGQAQWLRMYEAAQYNNLFGKKDRSSVLFP
ncbi:MAG: LTA synthase family protein [Eubacteriales bacterium]|nr:LTA synthase family protein [Eubacteriales bacterium]